MAQTTTFRFEGGPLAGTERRKTAPARCPAYLTTEGETLYTPKGDRLVHAISTGRRSNLSTTAAYLLEADDTSGDTRTLTYRFITIKE
jgi:hypothetical protein